LPGFSGLTFSGTRRPGFSGRICCFWPGYSGRSFSGMGNLKKLYGQQEIVLVSTAGFSVLNTGIFWQEAKTKRLFSQCMWTHQRQFELNPTKLHSQQQQL
jgi:hypothetical protein